MSSVQGAVRKQLCHSAHQHSQGTPLYRNRLIPKTTLQTTAKRSTIFNSKAKDMVEDGYYSSCDKKKSTKWDW